MGALLYVLRFWFGCQPVSTSPSTWTGNWNKITYNRLSNAKTYLCFTVCRWQNNVVNSEPIFEYEKQWKENTLRNCIREWSGKTSTCSWVHWVLVALPVWVSLVLSVGCVTCMGIPGTECWLRYLYGYPWYWVLVALPVWVSLVECTEC